MGDLLDVLDRAVRTLTEGKEIAVAFSGGLDSSVVAVLAGKYAGSIRLYTVGEEDSQDVRASKEMCQHLGIEWEHIPMDEESLVRGLRESIRITGTVDPVTLSFEVPLMYILPHVKERYVIGGQGADEVFWGYSKYLGLSEQDLREQSERDFRTLESVTLPHESKMAARYGKIILYPYLDDEVRRTVSSMDFEYRRPVGDDRKRPLKDAAAEIGRPEIAERTKKAAQYGTGSMNMIKRLAKKAGLSISEYIQSLGGADD